MGCPESWCMSKSLLDAPPRCQVYLCRCFKQARFPIAGFAHNLRQVIVYAGANWIGCNPKMKFNETTPIFE